MLTPFTSFHCLAGCLTTPCIEVLSITGYLISYLFQQIKSRKRYPTASAAAVRTITVLTVATQTLLVVLNHVNVPGRRLAFSKGHPTSRSQRNINRNATSIATLFATRFAMRHRSQYKGGYRSRPRTSLCHYHVGL
jgi:hypothetical protein